MAGDEKIGQSRTISEYSELHKLESLIELSPAAIALLRGPTFIFERTNKKWTELVSKREYIGRCYRDVYPDIGYNFIHERLTQVYETGVSFVGHEVKIRVETMPGVLDDRYYDFSYMRILDEEQKPYGIFCHTIDVTERIHSRIRLENTSELLELEAKRADEERSKFETAFKAVTEGIFIFDSQGEPVFMNDGAAKVFGSDTAADLMRRVEYYFERLELYEMDGTVVPLSNWPIARALRGEAFRDWQLRAYRSDIGLNAIWSSSGELTVQRGTNVSLGVVVLRDITAQKIAEADILKAKQEAEAANNSKTAFMANMSHEIRTPIGVILGFCELMQGGRLSERERDDYLRRIVRNAKGLTRIIDDILDLTKVEAGRLEIEEIDFSLGELLHEIVDFFSDRAKERNLPLDLELTQPFQIALCSDPTRIRQILINVIGNAIKFTSSGSVKIKASSEHGENGKTKYSVRVIDTGIGLDKSMRENIFQPFVQADSSTNRLFGGTGLGLSISKRLALALGGNIEIESCGQGEGCTFLISFHDNPNKRAQLSSYRERVASPSVLLEDQDRKKLESVRILVAEDSPDNQVLIKRILNKNGADVEIANDGQEAIHKALADSFDLILMDVQMPRVNGYEATRRLRLQNYSKTIIALTAHAMAEEKLKSRDAGCDAHLTKPINASELIETIVLHLKL